MWTNMKCKKCHSRKSRHHGDYTDPSRTVVYVEPKTFWQKTYAKYILKSDKIPACPDCGSVNVKVTYEGDGK